MSLRRERSAVAGGTRGAALHAGNCNGCASRGRANSWGAAKARVAACRRMVARFAAGAQRGLRDRDRPDSGQPLRTDTGRSRPVVGVQRWWSSAMAVALRTVRRSAMLASIWSHGTRQAKLLRSQDRRSCAGRAVVSRATSFHACGYRRCNCCDVPASTDLNQGRRPARHHDRDPRRMRGGWAAGDPIPGSWRWGGQMDRARPLRNPVSQLDAGLVRHQGVTDDGMHTPGRRAPAGRISTQ